MRLYRQNRKGEEFDLPAWEGLHCEDNGAKGGDGGLQVKQIITKDKRVLCETTVPYPPEIVASMKRARCRVREVSADGN